MTTTATTELTPRQRQIWQWLIAYQLEHHRPPTIREIGKAHGIASPSGVVGNLMALSRKGAVTYTEGTARGWIAVHRGPITVEQSADGVRLILAGTTPCALTAEEARELYAALGRMRL